MTHGTPWGMINARRERANYRGDLPTMRHKVAIGLDEAVHELDKPLISKVKITEILLGSRAQL